MILDSDVVIDLLRQRPSAITWFAGLSRIPSVSGVAALEISFGAANAVELKQVERFLARFTIVWPNAEDMERSQKLATFHLSQGTGLLDAVTAALAIRLREEIAMFNVKHFVNIPDPVLTQPYLR